MERRNLIQILSAGLATSQAGVSQHRHDGSASAETAAAYKPRALAEPEYRLIDQLADIILPADETSPGAHDAGVARYIDIVLLYGDKQTLASWKLGMEAVDAAAKKAHGRAFTALSKDQQIGLVEQMARNESAPENEMQRLFAALKPLTIEAFYLSAAGRKSLGYEGNTAVASFPGCTHPEHHT